MSFPSITSSFCEERDIRSRLVRFYEKHNPQQLNHIDTILFVYKDHWDELFDALAEKYEGRPTQSKRKPFSFFTTHEHEGSSIDILPRDEKDPDTPSFFKLRDPILVVQDRLKKNLGDSKEYESTITYLNSDTIQNSQKRLQRRHLTVEDEEAVVLRLRLQQLFMRFIPNEIFHMEEIMSRYREAYKEKVRFSGDSCRFITDKEWQEAMIKDFLCEFDQKGIKNDNHDIATQQMKIPNFNYRYSMDTLSSFSPMDTLEVAEPLLDTESLNPNQYVTSKTPVVKTICAPFSLNHFSPHKNENIFHSNIGSSIGNLYTPPGDNWLADAADRFSTTTPPPPPPPPPQEKRSSSLTPFESKSMIYEEDEQQKKNEKKEEKEKNKKSKNRETTGSFIVLRRNICVKEVLEMFLQTNEEQEAENILDCLTREGVLDSPFFHYRLFFLLCGSLEILENQEPPFVVNTTSLSLSKREVRIPYWESSFQSCLIWSAKPPREGHAFLLENNDFIENIPTELMDKIQTAWFVSRSIGLEYLWRDEVTFADVVALHMRYFVHRYAVIKWVVLRPFFHLRKSNTCNDRFQHNELNRNLGNAWELLWFIDAVNEIGRTFGNDNELCWIKYIQIWLDEYKIDEIITSLQDEYYSKPKFSELYTTPFDQNKEKKTNEESDHRSILTETKKRLPYGIETLLTCTVILCLRIDHSLSVITYNDVCATYHCLSVAAISEKEKYDRFVILKEWEDEYTYLNYLAEQSTALVSLQERECRQRGAVEVEEFTIWLKLVQSVFSACTVKNGILVTLPEMMNPPLLYYPLSSVSQSTTNRNVSGSSMSSTFLDPVMCGNRWTVRQRVAALFEREAKHQRRLKEQRQVEKVAYMLRNGKLSL
ncbi:uncharacterized protein TM35_000032930 [Trypanosoma theileri]|uniref:Uncharacterized protein n=1 Tax=Trypanosoma theileri TaxID=67003 RepID=A0A1X0P7Y4_9TRYP|nr:uncharacterized protein TM35_000032930 [Trypanosoma theileri]ORC92540.1 hypothetical protein TM35_000032930 [Trypanosoma theileri]